MAKVSVIIPTYNCIAYLPKAINSVLDQTCGDYEVIVINDNSTDETSTYLNQITDTRLKVLTTKGVGASEARNIGIREANGEFVAFLDADDFWHPEKLEKQLNLHANHPNLAMSFTNYDHLDEQYQLIIDCFGYWNQFQVSEQDLCLSKPLECVIENNIVGTSTVMVKRVVLEQLGMFDAQTTYAEDWELWLRICDQHDVGVVNSVLTGYLMRNGSATQTDSRRLDNLKSVESIIKKYQSTRDLERVGYASFNKANARVLEGYADYYRGLKQFSTAILFDLRALKLAPQIRRFRSLLGDCKKLTRLIIQ